MRGAALRQARLKAGLSQVEAAGKLGVSQTLLSMMEKGRRSATHDVAVHAVKFLAVSPTELPLSGQSDHGDKQLAAELGALEYPAYAHLSGELRNPAEILFDALDRADLDARVVEALPWLPLQYPNMNWDWLVSQAKQHNRQNRLGFVVGLAARAALLRGWPSVARNLHRVLSVLREARLAKSDTLCQESWPQSQRQYARLKRSKLAAFWNLDSRLTEKDLSYASA
jgi:transcriptional regulator with XRE-family HTH domain